MTKASKCHQAECLKLAGSGPSVIGSFRPIADIEPGLQSHRMRWLVLFPLSLAVSACGSGGPLHRSPDVGLVDEVEAKLGKVPCVGSLDRWERHFTFKSQESFLASLLSFGTSGRWFDYSKLRISFYQAGFEEFRAGRIIGRERPPAADDREYDLVFGDYDIPSRTLSIWACGPNMGGPDVNIIVR